MSISNNTIEGRESAPSREGTMAEYKAGPRKRQPTHPGTVVRTNLDAVQLSVYEAARRIGMTRTALGNICNSDAAVTVSAALKFGRLFSNRSLPKLLLDMQTDFDLWQTEQKLQDDLKGISPAKKPKAA